MRNSVRCLLVALALAGGAFSVAVTAQSAEKLYSDRKAQELELRAELARFAPTDVVGSGFSRTNEPSDTSTDLLRRIRDSIKGYEAVARQYPRSGYSDNALWQAAVLSSDLFWQFGEAQDRANAIRLFARLKAEFPTSSLLARIPEQTRRLQAAAATPARPPVAPPAPTATRVATPAAATRVPGTTLKVIRREVLADALRVTLELERETAFSEERLDGATRLSIDLRDTQATEALRGATITFPDDIVRQARVEREAPNRTRVTFDLQGAARHSVYTLYNPYRIVIDFERTAPAAKTPIVVAAAPLPSKNVPAGKTPTAAPLASRKGAVPTTPAPATAARNGAGGFSLSRQLGLGVSRVVIDPGHGGRDPGAQIQDLDEAEVVLDIALELERLLGRDPNVEVVLTRRTDAYVALEERTAIANKSNADLFLSIHVNASANQTARGFETYFLNFASNPEAEAVAARENAGSVKTMSNLPEIVKAIALNNKIDESRDFATMVQRSLQERLKKADPAARNLGVKQAPFMVLIGATMPSVLVEVSFLTNRSEATLLRSENHRRQIAEALLAGIMNYQRSLKRTPELQSAF
jgi:N-acetylmuramoyl-L-alanine amidase